MKNRLKPALPVFLAWACAILAAVCLLGWLFGIETLNAVSSSFPAMVPLTALMALLASGSLQLRHAGRAAGLCYVVLLLALSGGILLAYGSMESGILPGWPLVRSGAWGVSSPLTASLFFGIGLSLLALPHARFIRHAQWIALAVLFVSLLTLGSYLLRDTFLYRLLPGTGTSILTALALSMLAAGCLGARPREGIMAALAGEASGARVARHLLLATVMMPVLIGMLAWTALHFALVDTDTAIALLIWAIVALLVVVTWRGILRLSRAEAALEQAMDALRRTDANKDRFLAVLAHELRNPLAPVRAAADLLRMPAGLDAERQRRTGDIIARQSIPCRV